MDLASDVNMEERLDGRTDRGKWLRVWPIIGVSHILKM